MKVKRRIDSLVYFFSVMQVIILIVRRMMTFKLLTNQTKYGLRTLIVAAL